MPKEIYRSCASIAVFRKSDVCSPDECGAVYQMLLVHKPRKKDAWQLPQGGCESGESTVEAALRELQEEAGITATVIETSPHVYQYDFPQSYRRFRPDHVKGQRIEYVFAIVQQGAQVQVDDEEIDQYVWVISEQISQYIQRKKYCVFVQKLYRDGAQLLQKQHPA